VTKFDRTKITLYKVYHFVEGEWEAYLGRPWGEGSPPAGKFMTVGLVRDTVQELVDELRTRHAVAGRRVVGIHAYEYPQDAGSWGEIEAHYQGDDLVLFNLGWPEMVEPEHIILNIIRSIQKRAGDRPHQGQLDQLRKAADQLEPQYLAFRRGELRPISRDIPF
jgi:hypothetical protein